jgi:hypothetical protein
MRRDKKQESRLRAAVKNCTIIIIMMTLGQAMQEWGSFTDKL